jgi:hypothetical protein
MQSNLGRALTGVELSRAVWSNLSSQIEVLAVLQAPQIVPDDSNCWLATAAWWRLPA